ncbi:MAG: phosphatidylserine decarboxylase family protein [Deltaproteobacteria bacterium]|nr:phosphatidylserine decarboxylase family protein [Deltaproteobacteria bacterium]
MKRLRYPIAIDGIHIILFFLMVTLFAFFFTPFYVFFSFGILFLWSILFFRNPKRVIAHVCEKSVYSPADGQVVATGPAEEPIFSKTQMTKISIFMNVFNVHVNRSPVKARVEGSLYKKGKFYVASKPSASIENEQSALLLRWEDKPLVLVQIAGKIARRIVNYATLGCELQCGQPFGLIKFGSRVDLYLPPDIKVLVQIGQKVLSGKTVLAQKK